jgi:hypothetical protein
VCVKPEYAEGCLCCSLLVLGGGVKRLVAAVVFDLVKPSQAPDGILYARVAMQGRHINLGEKRPPAPSVLREQHQVDRKKGLSAVDGWRECGPDPAEG